MSLSANHPIRTPQEILAANAHKRRNKTVGDRFIPSRSNMNIDAATYLLTNETSGLELDGLTASQASYRTQLAEACGIPLDQRILSFKQKAPGAPEGTGQELAKKYGCSGPARASHKLHRHVPESCERVLDAPDIVDDYYLNCLDWSSKDVLAVGLGSACYLWDASEGTTDLLMDMENDHYVSSVSWNGSGRYLAVGLSNATVRLFDPSRGDRPLRQLRGHADRVSSMSWNGSVLTTAGKDSVIINHDVRMRDHIVSTFQGHTQEVCGLKWSPDGQFLASGGNDNLLHIWNMTSSVDTGAPVHTFDEHQAAVKALAWSPHQSNLLASGGGTADGCIKFWNINKGSIVRSVDTGSQVCALLWNRHEKEILSCHGNNACSLTLWKYPTMTRIGEMKGHTQRPLHMAVNPAGTTVCSAGADETLRLWSAFNEAPTTCRTNASSAQLKESTHAFRSVCIR